MTLLERIIGTSRACGNESRALLRQAKYALCDLRGDSVEKLSEESDLHKVILIPGFFALRSTMQGQADYLRKKKKHPKKWSHPFWQHLDENSDRIADILQENYRKKGQMISLIGHSQGGLIVKDIITRIPDAAEFIRSVVFLAVPHQGTVLTYVQFFIPFGRTVVEKFIPVCEDMVPGSDYLIDLNSRKLPEDIPVTNYYSKFDQAVIPWQSALLPSQRNVKNTEVKGVGHLAILDKYNLILEGLEREISSY